MTITVSFHQSGYRTFKDYYLRYVTPYLRWAFPQLVSYTRFVELMGEALIPLCAYLHTRKGRSEGVAFIDSTLLAVCHPKRSERHRVFAGLARWGRNSRLVLWLQASSLDQRYRGVACLSAHR